MFEVRKRSNESVEPRAPYCTDEMSKLVALVIADAAAN
jgi:hypothetical protein